MKTKLTIKESEVANVWSKDSIKEYIDTTKKTKYPKKTPPSIKMLTEHFTKDKWPLGLNYVTGDLAFEILGFSVLEYCLAELSKKGIDLSVGEKDGDLVLYLEDYVPPKKKASSRKSK